jgi:photosystem II stability/assembly factor-like uncharacterized protein
MRRRPALRATVVLALIVAGCASQPIPTSTTSPSPPPVQASVAPSASAAPSATPSAGPTVAPSETPVGSAGAGPPGVPVENATVKQTAKQPALVSVAFVDPATGWAGGDGVLLGTANGGTSWRTEWTGDHWIQSLSALDRDHAWGLAYAPLSETADELVRTTDGGRVWTTIRLNGGFREIAFSSSEVGWAVVGGVTDTTSGPGRLEETSDGGLHWRTTALTVGLESVCFASPSLGWAASGSAVYRTLDGGGRWTRVDTGPNSPNNPGWQASVKCTGASAWVLWTGGGGGGSQVYRVSRTLDRGARWTIVLGQWDDALPNLPRIDAYSGPFSIASAGDAGFIGQCPACGVGDSSYTWTTNGGRTFNHAPFSGLSGASVTDISFGDPSHGWVAGSSAGGFLLATTDGGRSWHRAYPFAVPWPMLDISFVSPELGFGLGLVGDGRAVLATSDGGQSWRIVGQLPADPWFLDRDPIVSFVDPSHGWVATSTGVVATSDGGRTWHVVPGAPPGGVAFADLLDGCAGSFGTPTASTTDGGRTWISAVGSRGVVACAASLVHPAWTAAAQPFDPGDLLSIGAIVGSTNAWAVGLLDTEQFGIEATADGGTTWTAYRWPALLDPPESSGSDTLDAVSFVSATQGWAFTQYGRLFETTDGGSSWVELGPR